MRSDTYVIDGIRYQPTNEQWAQIEAAWSMFLEGAKQAHEERLEEREREGEPLYLDGGSSHNVGRLNAFYDRVREILAKDGHTA